MHDTLTDVDGLRVGHASDHASLTGCTVVVCERGAVAGVSVRGGAPGTRETDLCRPGTLIERVHAVLLTGGSAFGLEAASGVMRALRERGIGYLAQGLRVPIVPAAVIFDLTLGAPSWPDVAMGIRAVEAASSGPLAEGCVGAGTGATVGKVLGLAHAMKAGIGTASAAGAGQLVAALAVVNAGGDVVDPQSGVIVAGARDPRTDAWADSVALVRGGAAGTAGAIENTTLAVIATPAGLSVEQANHLAAIAHDGLARTIRPVHTLHDGDTIFALATGASRALEPDALAVLAVLAVEATERAVLSAVRAATAAGNLPAAGDR